MTTQAAASDQFFEDVYEKVAPLMNWANCGDSDAAA